MAEANVNPTEEAFYYFCYLCRLRFKITRLSFVYISCHETEYTCVKCGKEFGFGFKVKELDFDDCYPYRCEVCEGRYQDSTQLLNHSYHHSGAWPLKCPFCQKGFPINFLFNMHLYPKSVQCSKCSESFLGKFCPARVFDENDEVICEKCSNGSELPSA
ncbi:hypothetical protein TNCV_325701 [Trichonephila clavipes]|nr:hypothetical protein TNCV_325701 [Trichonephila clavipes]